jgi:type I restriction enzyme R subunit
MTLTVNFGFLSSHSGQLVQLAARAESYFGDDPGTCIFKLRQFAELLCKTVASNHVLYQGERETFEEMLRRLSYERIIPRRPPICSMPFALQATLRLMDWRAIILTRCRL